MWKNFEKKRMDINVAVHKNETKGRAHIKIRATCIFIKLAYHLYFYKISLSFFEINNVHFIYIN